MYKFIGLIAALGLLGATSLTPVAAAPTAKDGVKNSTLSIDDFSAAKKKKKAKKKAKKKSAKKKVDLMQMEKKSSLSTDLSAAKKKKAKKKAKKKSKKKKTDLILYRIAA